MQKHRLNPPLDLVPDLRQEPQVTITAY